MNLALWWGDAVAAVQALPLGRPQKAGKQMAEDVAWAARQWQRWEEVGKHKARMARPMKANIRVLRASLFVVPFLCGLVASIDDCYSLGYSQLCSNVFYCVCLDDHTRNDFLCLIEFDYSTTVWPQLNPWAFNRMSIKHHNTSTSLHVWCKVCLQTRLCIHVDMAWQWAASVRHHKGTLPLFVPLSLYLSVCLSVCLSLSLFFSLSCIHVYAHVYYLVGN